MHQLNLKFHVNLITRILLGFMLNQPRWTLREKRGWIWCWLFFMILINLNARDNLINYIIKIINKQLLINWRRKEKLETQLVPLLLYPLSLNFNYVEGCTNKPSNLSLQASNGSNEFFLCSLSQGLKCRKMSAIFRPAPAQYSIIGR